MHFQTTSPPRGRFQGVGLIVRFNWPMYAAATIGGIVALWFLITLRIAWPLRVIGFIAVAIGLFWNVASLVVSYWVYDRSPLYQWQWLPETLPTPPAAWLNVHCGFDESTLALRELFPNCTGRTLDIFDAAEMTEPSIMRARQVDTGQPAPEPADYRRLPVDDASVDAVFTILSAHELRTPAARAMLFHEFGRVLRPGGRVVVVEHLRDAANFIAFGPGFVHFHSRPAWLVTFQDGGLVVERQFRITPFVAVFVLRRPA
jgi:SAM-dependent methyltransferase